MLCFVLVLCLTALATSPLFAQKMEDVIYLKNGEIVRGRSVAVTIELARMWLGSRFRYESYPQISVPYGSIS